MAKASGKGGHEECPSCGNDVQDDFRYGQYCERCGWKADETHG